MSENKTYAESCDFVITNPRWVFNFFLVAGILSLIGITVFLVLFLVYNNNMDGGFVSMMVALGILLIICGLGVYICLTEKFILKDGVYFYNKPFKRNQSARVEDLAGVEIRACGRFVDVIFWGKSGKKLIHFYDDGTVFSKGLFELSLIKNGIPFTR